jgi:hypothetical protein
MHFKNRKISLNHPVPKDYEQLVVKEQDVRELIAEARQA